MQPTSRHRLANLAQSALLVIGMAAIAWFSLSAVLSQDLALAVVAGSTIGMAMAPATPKRFLLAAYGARRLDRRTFPQGIQLLDELAGRAHLRKAPELFYIPSSLPNAFAVGSPDDSAICITDGLVRILDGREFAGVMAHEIAHIANHDLWIMGLADFMTRIVSIASWIGQILLILSLPFLLFGAAIMPWYLPLVLIFGPTIMALLQFALSRSREFDADLGAARLTGDPAGLASALLKLERRVGRFWEDIFLPGRRIPEPSLLRTHPPTEARVERLRNVSGEIGRQRIEVPRYAPGWPRIDDRPRFRRTGFFY